MDLRNQKFSVKDFEVTWNKKTLLSILLATGFSLLISAELAFIFSHSIITMTLGIIIGLTIAIMSNYFLITYSKLFKKIKLEFLVEEDKEEQYHSVMKIE
ncbi:MAG: hypothetical protein V5A68_00540 [Candidatus Thermoplasmatota archaeon]